MPQHRPVQQQHALGLTNHAPLQIQPSRVMACRQMPQGFTFLKAFTLKWWVLGASRSSGCRKKGPDVNQVNTKVLERRQDRGKTKASTPVGRKYLRTKNSVGVMGHSSQAPRLGVSVDRAQAVTADAGTQESPSMASMHVSLHTHFGVRVPIKMQLSD